MTGRALVIFGVVVIIATLAYGVWVMSLSLPLLLMLIVVGGLIQNLIATRAAAQTAFNPARVMGVLLQGACALMGGSSANVNLAGAGFVAGSGAQAGVLTADLAYGRWFKVPSRWQYWMQLATVVPCSLVAAYVYTKIQAVSPPMLEGGTLPAPVAKIWATTALIFDGRVPLPAFAVEAMLIAGAVGVVYTLLETTKLGEKWLPGSVGIGIGLVLPVSYDVSFFIGGFILWIVMGRWLKISEMTLTTICVGCIVAEGIGGVIKPILSMAGLMG
jgi:hypothetical protein